LDKTKPLSVRADSFLGTFLNVSVELNSTQGDRKMAELLTEAEIQERANHLEGWVVDGKALTTTRKFKDFVEAIAFVNQIVEPAEAAGHHPDLEISYNKVTISLTTHDAGGLTCKDFDLAQVIYNLS
jgi:4a-hydroxytetrahydrobiopterin dehydratase